MLLTKPLLCLLFLAALLSAQTTHSVTLTWADTLNPTGTTYSVYRSTGPCSGTPTFTSVATGLTAMTYADASVTIGPYCYRTTAVLNGIESDPSNTADALVKPFPPPPPTTKVK